VITLGITEGEAWAIAEGRARQVPGWVAFLPPGVTVGPEERETDDLAPIVLPDRQPHAEPVAPPAAPEKSAPLQKKDRRRRFWILVAAGTLPFLFLFLAKRKRDEE